MALRRVGGPAPARHHLLWSRESDNQLAMRASYRDDRECASSDTAAGYELWGLCNDHLLFHQSRSAGPIFLLPCHAGTKCKGGRMSIPIPDEKMDDYARDCVVRLASRVDDRRLRERLLQMAREWKAAAMKEIGYRQ